MQAGLLYETLSGRSGNYVQQVVVTCGESLDDDALRRAWLALVQRHRALRTGFVIGESAMPRQRIHEEVDLGIVVADWRSLSDDERESRWQELLVAERQAGFEPAYPPLMRVAICRLADAETRLLWTYHHAILDGRSRLALLRELFELYDEARSGQTAERHASLPFEQFAEWAARRGSDPGHGGVLAPRPSRDRRADAGAWRRPDRAGRRTQARSAAARFRAGSTRSSQTPSGTWRRRMI